MGMTKKEQALVEELKMKMALRWTEKVEPDIPPPKTYDEELSKGFIFNAYAGTVSRGCSSNIYHSVHSDKETNSHDSIWLYSSRKLALRAMRHEMELQYARKLREIDKQIEMET